MRKVIGAFAVSTVLGTACIGSANAATLDFTEVGTVGIVDSTVINLSNATLTSLEAGFYLAIPGGTVNGLGNACGLADDDSCAADWQIDFASDVTNLTMTSFTVNFGDSVEVSAFLDGALLGSVAVDSQTSLDLSGFGAIDRLFFDDAEVANGIGFGDFNFDEDVAVIPIPAALPLYLAGLGLLGLVGWRKRRTA